ncbi:MAG: glycosyltransferase [Thermoleophilaceae bacterium]
MRLLHAIAQMAIGGAERIVVQLADAAKEHGDRVAVAGAAGPLDAELAKLDLERIELPGADRSLTGTALAALRLASPLRRFGADLVHSHNVRATVVASTAARLANPLRRPPLLASFHGVVPGEYRMAARLLRCADRVVCVSRDVADALIGAGFPAERTEVVRNAVALPAPLSGRERARIDRELSLGDGPVVSIVGRLAPQKAHSRFLEAAALVARDLPDANLLVVGDGPLRNDLERQASELGLGGRVTFTGARSDARELIARSDLVAFSSDWEGLSLVALEALAAAVPVVSTDVEGMHELLSTGAGVVVGHEPSALAGAIRTLLEEDDRRAAMGALGRQLIEREYSLQAMVEAYWQLYGSMSAPAS